MDLQLQREVITDISNAVRNTASTKEALFRLSENEAIALICYAYKGDVGLSIWQASRNMEHLAEPISRNQRIIF